MFRMPLISFLTVTCRVGSVIPRKFSNSASLCQKYAFSGRELNPTQFCQVPTNPFFKFCSTRSLSGRTILDTLYLLFSILDLTDFYFLSVSPIMRYEGIQSFYDFRNYSTDQLKKDAQKLIDVSNLSFKIILTSTFFEGCQSCV